MAVGEATSTEVYAVSPDAPLDHVLSRCPCEGRFNLSIDRPSLGSSKRKWTEAPDERRMLSNVAKGAQWLGKRAAPEHWLVCRTPHPYLVTEPVNARVVNGYAVTDWLG